MDADIQTITLMGHLISKVDKFVDKNGHEFIRFKMSCRKTTFKGDTKNTVYRVCCYQGGFENLKEGDQVYVSGDLDISVYIDDKGKVWLNNEVFAIRISKGSIENSRVQKTNKK